MLLLLATELKSLRRDLWGDGRHGSARNGNGNGNGTRFGWREAAMALATFLMLVLGGAGAWINGIAADIHRIDGIQQARKSSVERIDSMDSRIQDLRNQMTSMQGQLEVVRSELERWRRPAPPLGPF